MLRYSEIDPIKNTELYLAITEADVYFFIIMFLPFHWALNRPSSSVSLSSSGLWSWEGQRRADLGSVADSGDLWDRNPHRFSGCCGPHPLHVYYSSLTKNMLHFLHHMQIVCYTFFMYFMLFSLASFSPINVMHVEIFCKSFLSMCSLIFSGSSSCVICLSTWPVLYRRCSAHPTGDLDSSSITGENSFKLSHALVTQLAKVSVHVCICVCIL